MGREGCSAVSGREPAGGAWAGWVSSGPLWLLSGEGLIVHREAGRDGNREAGSAPAQSSGRPLTDAPGAGAQHRPWGESSSRVPRPPPLCSLDPGAHTATRPQGHRWTPPDHKTRLLGPQPARSADIAGATPESPSRRGA